MYRTRGTSPCKCRTRAINVYALEGVLKGHEIIIRLFFEINVYVVSVVTVE